MGAIYPEMYLLNTQPQQFKNSVVFRNEGSCVKLIAPDGMSELCDEEVIESVDGVYCFLGERLNLNKEIKKDYNSLNIELFVIWHNIWSDFTKHYHTTEYNIRIGEVMREAIGKRGGNLDMLFKYPHIDCKGANWLIPTTIYHLCGQAAYDELVYSSFYNDYLANRYGMAKLKVVKL